MTKKETAVIIDGKASEHAKPYRQALLFECDLIDGTETTLTIIHNNKELNFEDSIAGTIKMLKTSFPEIKTILPRAGSISSGKFEQICFYKKIILK